MGDRNKAECAASATYTHGMYIHACIHAYTLVAELCPLPSQRNTSSLGAGAKAKPARQNPPVSP